ncbi:MAG: hypothetical protein ACJLS2_02435 [Microcella pacifica]
MTDPEWVTVGQAVIVTGKSERTIRRITADHDIDAKQDGRRVLWKTEHLRRAIELRKWGGQRHAAPGD